MPRLVREKSQCVERNSGECFFATIRHRFFRSIQRGSTFRESERASSLNAIIATDTTGDGTRCNQWLSPASIQAMFTQSRRLTGLTSCRNPKLENRCRLSIVQRIDIDQPENKQGVPKEIPFAFLAWMTCHSSVEFLSRNY